MVLFLPGVHRIFLRLLVDDAVNTARELLRRTTHDPAAESSSYADDLLLFLYRLKDEYRIVKPSSRSITGKSFSVLDSLIYNLESSPDEALANTATLEFVRLLLEDLVQGNILIQKK